MPKEGEIMTNSVQLAVGMYGITRDGKRVGPFTAQHDGYYGKTHPFGFNGRTYMPNGKNDIEGFPDCADDIICAGYTWTDLGAKVGDTVRRVYSSTGQAVPHEYVVIGTETPPRDSLYIIVKRAEPVIEWGEWVDGPGPLGGNKLMERVDGKLRHRLPKPKPPVVETRTRFATWADGTVTTLCVTRTDGVVTATVLP